VRPFRWQILVHTCLVLLLASASRAGAAAPVVAAAGDIGCPTPFTQANGVTLVDAYGEPLSPHACQQAETARLIEEAGDYSAVLALGDLLSPSATLYDFQTSYEPSWGRFREMMLPVVGNHEYATDRAQGYFDYFNGVGVNQGRAGKRKLGWHQIRLGRWLLIGLNSNCRRVSCSGRSRQATWLRRVLRKDRRSAKPSSCILAYWHHPRFSSGRHGNAHDTGAFWRILRRAGADVVLNGHDHVYERFLPLAPSGALDPGGITQFTVGTGGNSLFRFHGDPHPGSAARIENRFGILRLRLKAKSFRWNFIATNGQVLDAGTHPC
jgi:hypothetical protein